MLNEKNNDRMTLGELIASIKFIKEALHKQDRNHDKILNTIATLDKKFASKSRFSLLEKTVYGAVGIILIFFLTQMLNLL